ncbi:MAG: pentapeptide repeat-containing protein [Saprospiraceae bacterium]|nr:pentapeptide repeat-containing protein [Saprospiraceae bacterium]
MSKSIEKTSFEKRIYFEEKIEGYFEDCDFKECDFTDASFENSSFANCRFRQCNFSNTKVIQTNLVDCHFIHCKMVGVSFDLCEKYYYTLRMEDSSLDYASFYGLKLRSSKFKNCTFREADFTLSDVSSVDFDQCDFTGAHFEKTNLEKADLRTCRNYLIDPDTNKIKKARFSMPQVVGLLYKYDIVIEE